MRPTMGPRERELFVCDGHDPRLSFGPPVREETSRARDKHTLTGGCLLYRDCSGREIFYDLFQFRDLYDYPQKDITQE